MPNLNKLIEDGIKVLLCIKCKRTLPLQDFHVMGKYINYCKDCERVKLNTWRKDNPEKSREQGKRNYYNHREQFNLRTKLWKQNHKEYMRAYGREKYKKANKKERNEKFYKRLKTDHLFRIKHQMRTDLKKRLKKMFGSTYNKPSKLLGCTLPDMKIYLESKFQVGMNWNNYGGKRYNQDGTKRECWEIDHIIPMQTAKTKEEMYALCHYTNLQPLWWWDNVSKEKRTK